MSPEDTVRNVYAHRMLCNFVGFFGLAEVERVRGEKYIDSFRIRATPLLSDVVTFHV